MSVPILPSYLGTWDELIQWELSEPWLGFRGYLPKVTTDPQTRMSRSPNPWPWVVNALVNAVAVRALAATMPHGAARNQLRASADAAIQQVLDDYCGTPPRLVPWPWPGPPPWVFTIASQLTATANTMSAGPMRENLLEVAGQMVDVFMHHKNDPPGPPPAPQGPGGGSPVIPGEGGPSTPDPDD